MMLQGGWQLTHLDAQAVDTLRRDIAASHPDPAKVDELLSAYREHPERITMTIDPDEVTVLDRGKPILRHRSQIVRRSGKTLVTRDVGNDAIHGRSVDGIVWTITFVDEDNIEVAGDLGTYSYRRSGSQAKEAKSAPEAPARAETPRRAKLVAGAPQPNAWAVIVGVEKYGAKLPPPSGARADAEQFAALARTSLGIAPNHIEVALDEQATKATLERHLAWLEKNAGAGSRIYFYFSGHGSPDAAAGTAYLLPYDGDPQFLDQTALKMDAVMDRLGKTQAREVLALVDSCFSGAGGRSVLAPGARPLVRMKEGRVGGQVALLSAAGGDEISGPVPSGDGGLFTHYLVEGLGSAASDMDGDGQISLQELAEWIKPRVARDAKKANREQTPTLAVGTSLGDAKNVIIEWGLPAK